MKKHFLISTTFFMVALAAFGVLGWSLISYFVNPLKEIYIKTAPTKTTYYDTEEFIAAGLEVVARYENWGKERTITDYQIVVDSPLNIASEEVQIVYTEGKITKTATFSITVNPRKITEMVVLMPPTKTRYYAGEFFDIEGLKLRVNCEDTAVPFEPKNIQISKQNVPLAPTDEVVSIAYTEGERTVFAEIPITVTEITTAEQEVEVANDLVGFLPDISEVAIEDSDTIEYIKNVVDSLTPEQKEQVGADERLAALSDRLAELRAQDLIAKNTEYTISYVLKAGDFDFSTDNPTIYKNADGAVALGTPISQGLYDAGYLFSHWENSAGQPVTALHDITVDTILYAVYELSASIGLVFVDNANASIMGRLWVPRHNGTEYKYSLKSSEVDNVIFDATACLPTAFYKNKIAVTSINTTTGREVEIAVDIASPQQVVEDNIDTPCAESIMLVFGENVREFALKDGRLSAGDLSDIYAYYNEQNHNYLNYYEINGIKAVYADLEAIDFGAAATNIVVVLRVENRFDLTIEYSGGEKVFFGLKGRQKISEALIEYAAGEIEILSLVDGLDERLNLSQFLLADTTLYLPPRAEFDIILHNGLATTTLTVPDYTTSDFILADKLPKYSKLGYIFAGWSRVENGEILSIESLNIVLQNYNAVCDLYANWVVNPNYEFPGNSVDYAADFVGEWIAKFNYNSKVFETRLNLLSEGVYHYSIMVNGESNLDITGEYRYIDNAIKIYSLCVDGDYQLIAKSDFEIDLSFIEDNILISSCFFVTSSGGVVTVERFSVVQTCGNVNFVNYYGEKFLGTYDFFENNVLTNLTEHYIIKLLSNGKAIVTIDDVTQKVLYRVVGGRIILLFNNSSGVKDITEFCIDTNRI